MTGTSLGRVTMPEGIMNLNLHWYDQPTVFDRLDEKGISWKVYFGDIPVSSILVHQWEPKNATRHRPMMEFALDASDKNWEEHFPEFVWIEPSYLPPGANDYHPPHDVYDGEDLVRRVYNALRANEELWKSSLLVVLFDEHGGFYDHVSPPVAIAPDHHLEEWSFDRLGVRVPAILVSPYIQNTAISKEFDHTSLLKYLSDKWNLGPLGQRTAQANSFAGAISLIKPREDTPKQLDQPVIRPFQVATPQQELTDHQHSMVSLSHALESMAEEDAEIVAARSRQVLSGAASQVDAAMDRFAGFLRQRQSLS
jgi:phospholipase C